MFFWTSQEEKGVKNKRESAKERECPHERREEALILVQDTIWKEHEDSFSSKSDCLLPFSSSSSSD
jgi:hypothetical protein